jgi:uncharacterized protein YvpB
VTEAQLMAVIPRNPNPNLGFRGNPSGNPTGELRRTLVDYGVYAAPVHQALLHYDFRSDVIMYGTDDLLASYISRGWPIEVWITYGLRSEQPRLAQANGAQFILVPFEHTVLVVGYDETHVYANDPFTGARVRYLWTNFNRAWGYLGNMALAIEPCAAPGPVTDLTVSSLTRGSIIWTWHTAANAVGYEVTVVHHGKKDKTVYQGTVTAPTLTLSAPSLKGSYDISVRSMSSCGGTSPETLLWVQIPTASATATPTTPTATSTPIEGTLTARPIATAIAAPSARARSTGTATAPPSATGTIAATPAAQPTANPTP